MLVTKEQQEALVNNYIKNMHNQDECTGFIDGIISTLDLLSKMDSIKKEGSIESIELLSTKPELFP